jgi:CBS domain-containing protein
MKCADLMSKPPEWLTDQDTIYKAASVMADAGVGFLPICDAENQVIGVITDRDLTTRVLAKHIASGTTSAAMVMSSPALSCPATADVRDAQALMESERKNRLVITDAEGRLAGILSLTDLVERLPGHQSLPTVKAVLSREMLGPRGGAPEGQSLLRDDPTARNLPIPSDDLEVRPSVMTGGHRDNGIKEFPG